jgi:single-strand DNA-binding protein
MSSRSLNKVQLIGNLTRDPELRYTPTGAAVCTIGLATNRTWTTESGEKKEETEFHRVVAWNKLAELCSQLLVKGRKIYVEGRLRTNSWQGQDGAQRTTTEVVIEDMIILDSRRPGVVSGDGGQAPAGQSPLGGATPTVTTAKVQKSDDKTKEEVTAPGNEDVNPDDIPF